MWHVANTNDNIAPANKARMLHNVCRSVTLVNTAPNMVVTDVPSEKLLFSIRVLYKAVMFSQSLKNFIICFTNTVCSHLRNNLQVVLIRAIKWFCQTCRCVS